MKVDLSTSPEIQLRSNTGFARAGTLPCRPFGPAPLKPYRLTAFRKYQIFIRSLLLEWSAFMADSQCEIKFKFLLLSWLRCSYKHCHVAWHEISSIWGNTALPHPGDVHWHKNLFHRLFQKDLHLHDSVDRLG